jgi:hypothetical protein
MQFDLMAVDLLAITMDLSQLLVTDNLQRSTVSTVIATLPILGFEQPYYYDT